MSKLRFRVVETAFKKKAATVETPAERPSEYFAKYVFNREKMFKYLPGAVYAKLTDAMDNGAPLERAIADEVAAGMKRWATELGVTHYTHWFQPLTEGTAEKHDAFVEHDGVLAGLGAVVTPDAGVAVAGKRRQQVLQLAVEHFLGAENVEIMEPDERRDNRQTLLPAIASDFVSGVELTNVVGAR